jgi:hypothetical protein
MDEHTQEYHPFGYNAVKSIEKSTDVLEQYVASVFRATIRQARNQCESRWRAEGFDMLLRNVS